MKKIQVKRGDIYYADLNPVLGSEQGGCRLVLIIQNDIGNQHSPTVIIAAITSKSKRKLPTHVVLKNIESLEKDSVVLLEQIRTIDKQRLKEYVCTLETDLMRKVENALRFSIGLPKKVEKSLVLCLCSACAGHFYSVPDYYILRANLDQRHKETCMFCDLRKGYNYYIGKKRGGRCI